MSTMTPTKKKKKRTAKVDVKATPAHLVREPEAPDRGSARERREAPDWAPHSHSEAPDAGDGRVGYSDHDFTNGRSQS
jgi:hypothetical protein